MRLRTIQAIKLTLLAALSTFTIPLHAQVETKDSLKETKLDEVVVEAALHTTSATVSTYYPTSRQKNASQNGIELLNRMAIPQLAIGSGTSVNTVSGQSVSLFIDWLPASPDDMRNMRMADVKRVEYYDYPSDPRFLRSAHVVNFIMKKYEYGGYLKASAYERFIANDGQLNIFGKFQLKNLSFDLGLGGSYGNSSHSFTESVDTYRLPQEDGTENIFRRVESVTDADSRNKIFWPTLKAVFNNGNITVSNTIGASFDHTPTDNITGNVRYYPDVFAASGFLRDGNSFRNSLSYSGNWNFILGGGNIINFNPIYSYSHTKQSSIYKENGEEFPNAATDDSHSARARLQFTHSFGAAGSLNVFCQGIYYHSATTYSGTAEKSDRLTTYGIGPGVSYGLSVGKCYLYAGIGFFHDRSKYAQTVEHSTKPWADVSFQYSANSKNHLSVEFHHMNTVPLSSYRSEAVIQVNPLLSNTGNPALKPYKSYDYGITYSYMPEKRFSLSAYVYGHTVRDRFAFVYTPSSSGILRNIEQPAGGFTTLKPGVYGRANLLRDRLQLSGQIAIPFCHNGYPFNTDKVNVNYALQAFWYFGAWNVGIQYFSEWGTAGNAANGLWTKREKIYCANIGWGNSVWNFSLMASNPFTWSWKSSQSDMSSRYFDRHQTDYGLDSHCYVGVSATYVFGFGKKVKRGDEVSRQTGANSAILE